jgi:ABC-type branched-subunit amino acid transport system substrate-binding protein
MNAIKLKMMLRYLFAICLALSPISQSPAQTSGTGYTSTEILIGNLMPYSGPASSYATIGKIEASYVEMINGKGGVNGRQIKFISYDDAYSPPKAVEQARRLVESDGVLAIVSPLGTPPNAAIQKYMNLKKVPHLFVLSGAERFSDHKQFPWTVGFNPGYATETRIYARYILEHRPNAKIAILWQNDDSGRDFVRGLEEGLGSRSEKMIVAKASFEPTDPVIDSQIVTLKSSGADTFVLTGTPRAGSQAIRKVAEMGWKPLFFVSNPQSSVATTLTPAGLDNAKGVLSSSAFKDPADPTWKNDPDVVEYLAFLTRYLPSVDPNNNINLYGYLAAQAIIQVLKQCGDDLSRDNVMRQATNLQSFKPAMLLPGITMNTSSDNHHPIRQLQMMNFDGERWQMIGDIISEQ